MQLPDYLRKHNYKPTPWAIQHGLAPATISRLMNKTGKITMDNAKRVRDATNGEVTLDDLCEYLDNSPQ